MAESGTFLLADISGYTEYLASSDLEHGPVIATDLLSQVVDEILTHFEVNKLEGDAVFSYTTRPGLDASTFLDLIDRVYAAFRRRLLSIGQATTCGCPACGLLPRLDLKLIAHSGTFIRQTIAGHTELVGSDVVLVHRLLKNSIGFGGAASGYVLLTEACAQQLGIDPSAEGLTAHVENYPHFGHVRGWVGNMNDRLEQKLSPRPEGAVAHQATLLLAATPGEVWNALAPGRSDSCVTSRLSSVHEVLEWVPYQRLLVEIEEPEARFLHELSLEETGEGTLTTIRWYRVRRRRQAPSWKEIGERLATRTTDSLTQAAYRFGQSA